MAGLYQKYQPVHITNISELIVALRSIWNELPQGPIDIVSFTEQLNVFIKANGGHFEYGT